MRDNYRPRVEDYLVKGQQLSLAEAGKFDQKFTGPTTRWTLVCQERHSLKISRKARIREARANG